MTLFYHSGPASSAG